MATIMVVTTLVTTATTAQQTKKSKSENNRQHLVGFIFRITKKLCLSKERKITPFFYITLFPRIHRHAVMYETEVSPHAIIHE